MDKVYTFDGNAEETQKIGGITYAKIADTAPNLHNVTKAVYTAPDGSTIEFVAEAMKVMDLDGGQAINATVFGLSIVAITLDVTGLWVYAQPGYGYCSLVEFSEPEEPTTPIGYIEYLVSPKYHMGKPFRGFIGWKLAQGGGGGADGEPALVSSDGYTLQDVNGLNLIPKEGK